jgi:hypothetical protein
MPECKIDISFKVIRVEVFEIASLDNFIGSDLGLEFFLAAYIITYYQAMITYSNMAYSRHYKFIRFVREEKINSSIYSRIVSNSSTVGSWISCLYWYNSQSSIKLVLRIIID